jgi:hypothetical protein
VSGPDQVERLVAEIRGAFPARRPAGLGPLAEGPREEPAATRADFADKEDWTTIEGRWLDLAPDGWSSALSFFTPEAARFYLPAYLVAHLRDELECVEPAFSLLPGTAFRAIFHARWDPLTPAQALAVAHYLERCADGPYLDRTVSAALETYWYGRCGPR